MYKIDISTLVREKEIRQDENKIFRIPKGVIPLEYEVKLQIFIPTFKYTADHRNMTFEGEVWMKLKTLQKTKSFALTSQGLTIHQFEVHIVSRKGDGIRFSRANVLYQTLNVVKNWSLLTRLMLFTRCRPPKNIQSDKIGLKSLILLKVSLTSLNLNYQSLSLICLSVRPLTLKLTSLSPSLTILTSLKLTSLSLTSLACLNLTSFSLKPLNKNLKIIFQGKKPVAITSLLIHKNSIIVNLEKEVDKNTIINAKVVYCGDITSKDEGLYPSTYIDENGKAKMTVISKNKPNFARTMVPCFDEPEYKAVWRMRIIHPKGTSALSNNDLESVEDYKENFRISTFHPTPKMSSYLLAVTISDFEYVETTTKSGVRIRIWTRREEISNLQIALEDTCRIFEKLEKMFKTPYPMKKLDLVGIVGYELKVTQDWGLMTLDERYLSFDPLINTPEQKYYIRTILSHELMHNWIGNLVTMSYWSEIWLIEGITTLFEEFGADFLAMGRYNQYDNFILNDQRTAFHYDSPNKYHPLAVTIEPDDAIKSFFNPITYKKAASVLYMIRKVVRGKVFMRGLRNYVEDNKFGNANDDYFLQKVQEAYDSVPNNPKLDITRFAESWTEQIGYPIVSARRVNATHIELTQKLYSEGLLNFILPRYSKPKHGFIWEIPIYYQNESTKNLVPEWLRDKPLYIESSSDIIINVDSDCYYRVEYSSSLWESILSKLDSDPKFYSARTKLRIIEDAFHLGKGSSIDRYIHKETERLPIRTYLSNLRHRRMKGIRQFLVDSKVERSWDFVAQNYKDDYKFDEVMLAILLINTGCAINSEECEKSVTQYYDELISSCKDTDVVSTCSKIPGPFRYLVYCRSLTYDTTGRVKAQLEKWLSTERKAAEIRYIRKAFECLRSGEVGE